MNKSTYINITTILIKSLYILLVLLLLGIILYISYSGYEKITFSILEKYDKLNRISEFRNTFFTYQRFVITQIALCSFLAMLLLLMRYFFKQASKAYLLVEAVISYCRRLLRILRDSLTSMSKKETTIFFTSLFSIAWVKFYFLLKFPFHIDEISSYMYFIDKGFLVSISYYPNPNNHIFFSLIGCLLNPFFTDPFYLMRIPVWLISLFASITVFIFIKKYFRFSTALVSYIIFSVTPFLFFYSIHGRGYIIMTFFTIVSTSSLIRITEKTQDRFYWITYVLSSVLGFYTMVIYLYPFVALSIYFILINFNKEGISQWKPFIKYNLLITILILALYSPVFLVSGISSITSNSWIIKMPFDQYINYFPILLEKEFSYTTGTDGVFFLIGPLILILAAIILIIKKEFRWLILLSASFLVPAIIVIIQRVQIYERIWTYLIFYQSLAAGIIFYYMIIRIIKNKGIQHAITGIISLGFILLTVLSYNRAVALGHGVYDEVKPIADYVYSKNAKYIYVTEMTYNHYIRYKYHIEKRTIKIDESAINLDSRYDFIIMDNKMHADIKIDSLKFLKVYSNEYAEVYELIK